MDHRSAQVTHRASPGGGWTRGVVALGALLFSGFLLSSVPNLIRDRIEIARDPVPAVARVEQVEVDSAYGWRPILAYRDAEGLRHRLRPWAWYPWWQRPKVGDEMRIVYARHRPHLARVDTFWGEFGGAVRFGSLGLLLGLGGLAVSWEALVRR
jgi:hypothetical protein